VSNVQGPMSKVSAGGEVSTACDSGRVKRFFAAILALSCYEAKQFDVNFIGRIPNSKLETRNPKLEGGIVPPRIWLLSLEE